MRLSLWKPTLVAVLMCGWLGTSASAAPAKGKGSTPAKPADDGGEIEMDPSTDPGAGSGSAAAPAATPATSGKSDGGEIEMDNDKQGDLAADSAASDSGAQKPLNNLKASNTPLSWQDIVTVIRKPFLKVRRTELMPFFSTTMNDNIIRHYGFGGQFNYYLSDALAVGIEGQYYVKSFLEPFDLIARQARRLPTVNQYDWSAALNFHYVPVYGKFAVLDRKIVTWEAMLTAGIGAIETEVIPRDPRFPGFNSFLISPNVGISLRFFLAKWLTIDFSIRDYIFEDQFEPTNRTESVNNTSALAKANADSALINDVQFQLGLSFWFPTSFEYTTFR